jgi:hypothetical protein
MTSPETIEVVLATSDSIFDTDCLRSEETLDQLNALRKLETKFYSTLAKRNNLGCNHYARASDRRDSFSVSTSTTGSTSKTDISGNGARQRVSTVLKPCARGLLQPLERWHSYLKKGLSSYYNALPQSESPTPNPRHGTGQGSAAEAELLLGARGNDADDFDDCETCNSAAINENTFTTKSIQYWRPNICEWVYKVLDYFLVDREIAFVTMSYLDRVVARSLVDRCKVLRSSAYASRVASMPTTFTLEWYQCAAIACLALASKVHAESDPRDVLSIRMLLNLSQQGSLAFDIRHVVEIESQILFSLQWHMHPPTSCGAASMLIRLLPPALQSANRECVRDEAIQLTYFLTELSIMKQEIISALDASTMALAALLVAMYVHGVPGQFRRSFLDYVVRHVQMDADEGDLDLACEAFEDIYQDHKKEEETTKTKANTEDSNEQKNSEMVRRPSQERNMISPKGVAIREEELKECTKGETGGSRSLGTGTFV